MREQKRRTLEEPTKALYVELPQSLYERLKQYCFDANMSKAYYVSELLEKSLNERCENV